MPAKFFLDTNILIYAYSSDDPSKKDICGELLARKDIYVSVAVLNEFCNIMRIKLHRRGSEIELAVNELMEYLDVLDVGVRDVREALRIWAQHGFHHFDALHLACAYRHGCDVFLTEDKALQHFKQGRLNVSNPFLAA